MSKKDSFFPESLVRLKSEEVLHQQVVYFGKHADPLYVGRIDEVTFASPMETLKHGLLAHVTLVQPDHHEYLADLFWKRYLSFERTDIPWHGFLYRWPPTMPSLDFKHPRRPGHFITIELKVPFKIQIAFEDDLLDRQP